MSLVIEGELVIKEKPESLVGQYGIRASGLPVDNDEGWAATRTGHSTSLAIVQLWRLRDFPEDTPIIEIKNPEKAIPFVLEKTVQVKLEPTGSNLDWFTVIEKLLENISDDYSLSRGLLQLWKETRFPVSSLYFLAFAKILDQIEYDPEKGWYRDFDKIEGGRTSYGISVGKPGGKRHRQLLNSKSVVTKYVKNII